MTLLRLSARVSIEQSAVRKTAESRQAHRVERPLAAMPAYAGGLRSNSTNVHPVQAPS